ncbi:hypothetical protein F5B22DRAFT_603334 [Xylaria bambusicola]|uniref:uncharacterized protein n=1 Tax=Xylaria bambusicola TaxID=326684 RepID=UPI002008D3E7|nr:uncharacterized protein F5B22DRAFT_603334 [Xylaria bambusicola]KAI0517542.1 hypothetical protein F5B22DRAFT_603334 [Xylaria bambusicola]
MPLSREPSQRALNWVKWNSNKSSSNSNQNSKRPAEPEIVHLGGARVGTAYEVLDLPAPDRSRPAERPLTQWTFNPPPPNPPGIGIAIASPNDISAQNHAGFDYETERPITQWFPEFQPEAQKDKNDTQHLTPGSVYPNVIPYTNNEEILPSPLSAGASSIATRDSTLTNSTTLRSPAVSPAASPIDHSETPQTRPGQFPKRSTSLSQVSRYILSPAGKQSVSNNAATKVKEQHLRRTQSSAEVPRATNWKGFPNQPFRELPDRPQTREAPPQEPRIQEPPRVLRSSPKPPTIAQDTQVLPPLTYPPPNAPLPPISGSKLAGHSKARDQLHQRGRSSSSDRAYEKSPPIEFQDKPETQQQLGPEHQLTSKERFWLHRHYRGEAVFLKAWGLQIESEQDRQEGRRILRELMEGEAQEERETQERSRMHHRSGSLSRSSSSTALSSRDGAALDVIAEERLSREFHLRPNETIGYADGGEDKYWSVGPEAEQRSRRARRSDKHGRSESTDSVLEQYLDLRMSNNH